MTPQPDKPSVLPRLNKLLARYGVTSRRQAEQWIREGRVRVNGRVVQNPATRCDADADRIEVDGKLINKRQRARLVIALNKPRGYVTTLADPHARHLAVSLIEDAGARLHPIGRLDADSRGLLLWTNDGELTWTLTHPGRKVPKVYRVWVGGHPDEQVLRHLRAGIPLADGRTAPATIERIEATDQTTLLEITIYEGRYRQLRRMFATVGHPAEDVQRIAFGPVQLGNLREGRWRPLSRSELDALDDIMNVQQRS